MDYILDTHVILWLLYDSHKLSATVQRILLNDVAKKYVCAPSLWEIAIKHRIGKLTLPEGM